MEAAMQMVHMQLEGLIRQSGAESVAVAFHDLQSGQELCINYDQSFHPASTFKICVMMELYRQSHQGFITLNTPVLIKNEFASIVDAIPFSLNSADDSEQNLYQRIGQQETLRELNRYKLN